MSSTNWFSEGRFGMFIHWGLYALPAGEWQGKTVSWVAEWIMRKFRIPVAEYEALAKKFNPVKFNAEQWVKDAHDAGMKYMIFTAKHHDGFAMFHSSWDKFNIVDATPFKRDVLAELAAACRKYGMKLGCYYSQDQDWHEAGASGNDWDFPVKTPEMFQDYINGKVKHQLKEILTNYGEISVIWFDTPETITLEQSKDLKEYVHSFQPECLVSGRVGNGMGDYISLGDNAIPGQFFTTPAEGLGTMNTSWGYRKDDHAYRSYSQLLQILAKMVSHNANYLLNVGPKGDGAFPAEARQRLKKIAEFMQQGGAGAVYGAGALGIAVNGGCSWGEVTASKRKVWFWVFKERKEMILHGLRSKIKDIKILPTGQKVPFRQDRDDAFDYHKLTIFPVPAGIKKPYLIEITLQEDLSVNPHAYYAAHKTDLEEK
ncbi:MAG: alpha-L-fucosidase [Lentisphaeria bacterium]|nr:alpha-L-fucosidase [Lentisphaeria bacterium]